MGGEGWDVKFFLVGGSCVWGEGGGGGWIPSFRSENSTSEARKGIKGEQCVSGLCVLQTYLVHWVVHFVLQDGLCDGGTEGR